MAKAKISTAKIVVRAPVKRAQAGALAKLLEVVKATFQRTDIGKLEIGSEEDHDGDEIYVVKIHHPLSARPVRVRGLASLDGKVRDEVWKRGIRRFVHIRHLFDDEQKAAD